LAIPIFSFFIPIYAFWHFDDFSWGNTRMVLDADGDGDRNETQVEDIEFDPSAIQKRRWQEYEDTDWEKPRQSGQVEMYDKLVALHSPRSAEVPISSFRTSPRSQHVDVSDTLGNDEYKSIEGFPSDQEIIFALYDILENADLMKVTRHQGQFEQGLANSPYVFFGF
jgi:Chitin synthase